MLKEELTNFHIVDVRQGLTILEHSAPTAAEELVNALADFSMINDWVIEGGGGLASSTKDIRDRLYRENWNEKNIEEEHIIDGVSTLSESHEIDHFREIDGIGIGLEIEWNNKPTFFDRDLSCFAKFHRINKINLGILIVRGPGLEEKLYNIYLDWVNENIEDNRELVYEELTKKMKVKLHKQVEREPSRECELIAKTFFKSKYGTSTTQWKTLMQRINNNGGYPAPLVLLGIKSSVFD